MDAMAAVEADRQEQEALDGILSELTALRAGCGLAPPPHGAGMSDTFQVSGTSAGRPDQQVRFNLSFALYADAPTALWRS
jgi:hypothetical protein